MVASSTSACRWMTKDGSDADAFDVFDVIDVFDVFDEFDEFDVFDVFDVLRAKSGWRAMTSNARQMSWDASVFFEAHL